MTKHLPNLLTVCNLLCGVWGIQLCLNGNSVSAAYLIGAAAVFDFFDGFAARLLNVSSPIGKELDSLADCVSFGVLPAFIMFQAISPLHPHVAYSAFIIAAFSALRLAKFNIDTRQTDSFIGVPTPANAMLMAAIPLVQAFQPGIASAFINLYVLVAVTVVMSLLLVSELPLFALKFKSFGWAGNEVRYGFLLVSVILLILLHYAALPAIIGLYIVLSLFIRKQS